VVTVIWSYTGLSTPEMEQRVTTYSQYAMSSASDTLPPADGARTALEQGTGRSHRRA
jgi:hypothetical protein